MEEQIAGEDDALAVTKKLRAPRPKQCRSYVLKRVTEVLPKIVDTFTDEAIKGSVPHTKELMRLSGLDREDVAAKTVQRRPRSFAQLLMEELERDGDAPIDGAEGSESHSNPNHGFEG